MNQIPAELKYAANHQWLRRESDGSFTVGITFHAQELLGDIVYVELPESGTKLAAGAQAGLVESVKSASDVYAPIAGEITRPTKRWPPRPKPPTATPTALAGCLKSSPTTPPTATR